MSSELSQSQIDALIAKVEYYKYTVSYGSSILGPLKSAPKIEPETEFRDILLYETGVKQQAQIITKNNAKITLELEDMATALTMLNTFKEGDNIIASDKAKELVLVPITTDENAKTISFGNVFLQPGLKPSFGEGDDPNFVTLDFVAKPGEDKVLFTVG